MFVGEDLFEDWIDLVLRYSSSSRIPSPPRFTANIGNLCAQPPYGRRRGVFRRHLARSIGRSTRQRSRAPSCLLQRAPMQSRRSLNHKRPERHGRATKRPRAARLGQCLSRRGREIRIPTVRIIFCIGQPLSQAGSTLAFIEETYFRDFYAKEGSSSLLRLSPRREGRIPGFPSAPVTWLGRTPSTCESCGQSGRTNVRLRWPGSCAESHRARFLPGRYLPRSEFELRFDQELEIPRGNPAATTTAGSTLATEMKDTSTVTNSVGSATCSRRKFRAFSPISLILLVLLQPPNHLFRRDIHGIDSKRATMQQAIREASGRRADIQAEFFQSASMPKSANAPSSF